MHLQIVNMHLQMVRMHLQMVSMHLQMVKMHLYMVKMHSQMIKMRGCSGGHVRAVRLTACFLPSQTERAPDFGGRRTEGQPYKGKSPYGQRFF